MEQTDSAAEPQVFVRRARLGDVSALEQKIQSERFVLEKRFGRISLPQMMCAALVSCPFVLWELYRWD